jgi:hypothetical protein
MRFRDLGIGLALLGTAGLALPDLARAQDPVAAETRRASLQELAAKLQQRDANDRREARAFAQRAGIPLRRELPHGGVLELQRVVPGLGPVFYITQNILAARTVSTDDVWPGGAANLALDGAGMTIAEWDGGAVYGDHFDLFGRVTQMDGASDLAGHATHVAGTLIGSGFLGIDTQGMAPAALLHAYDWNSDSAEMTTAAAAGWYRIIPTASLPAGCRSATIRPGTGGGSADPIRTTWKTPTSATMTPSRSCGTRSPGTRPTS